MSEGASIILGTAQFGMRYGVANQAGQFDRARVDETLQVARAAGVRLLDTAVGYGESEAMLGAMDLGDMRVMTKLPAVPEQCPDVREWVRQQVSACLNRLQVSSLYSLSFHRPAQLLEGFGQILYDEFRSLQDEGVIGRIGVSIYDPEELHSLFEGRRFDIVQAPFNILDRRLVTSVLADRLNERGCQVHARSIFLQGLLLLPEAKRPPYFQRWRQILSEWDSWLLEVGLSPVQACIRYARSAPGVGALVVGVDGPEQLRQILDATEGELPPVPDRLSCSDPGLVNPARWT